MRFVCIYLLCCLSMAGCSTQPPQAAPDNLTPADFVRPAKGALVLLLPAMPPAGMDVEWVEKARLAAQLTSQLKAAGYQVTSLERDRYELMWAEETSAVGGVYDRSSGALLPRAYNLAMASLVRRACSAASCALVIQPRLAWRTIRVDTNYAEWDGVRQTLRVSTYDNMTRRYSGSSRAFSIELTAITRNGTLAYRRFGGLALAFDVNVREAKQELSKDLFSSEADSAEAVRITLEPLTRASY